MNDINDVNVWMKALALLVIGAFMFNHILKMKAYTSKRPFNNKVLREFVNSPVSQRYLKREKIKSSVLILIYLSVIIYVVQSMI